MSLEPFPRLEGPVLHSPPPLCPYSTCPPPPLREISGAGYRDTVPGLPQTHPPSHGSCDGPPQVSLLLDNGPSVARWDSDTSFFIRRQAYSSSEVTPPPTPKPLNGRDQEIHTNKFRAMIRIKTCQTVRKNMRGDIFPVQKML